MAERRMFAKRIIESASFLKMPISSRELYFHLCLNADDDGVVEAYNVMNLVKATEDDLRVLMSKGYVQVLNPDLVTYISDWLEHNKLRPDRKIDSIYKDLLLQILPNVQLLEKKDRADRKKKKASEVTEDDGDTHGTSQGQTGDINGTAQYSVVEDSIDKNSTDKNSTGECRYQLGKEILTDTQYNKLLQSYPKKLLDEVINRIISHPYIGCLNVNTISQWCMEAKKRQGVSRKNTFNNFSQREYDFEELERVLLAN